MTVRTHSFPEHPQVVPIPLREDFVARVHLPPDLTRAEAKKIANVVLAYAAKGDGE